MALPPQMGSAVELDELPRAGGLVRTNQPARTGGLVRTGGLQRVRGGSQAQVCTLSQRQMMAEQIAVRDVCMWNMTSYCGTEQGPVQQSGSIWDLGEAWIVKANIRLNSPTVRNGHLCLAYAYMLLGFFQQPMNDQIFPSHHQEIVTAATVVFWLISVYLAMLAAFK